MPRPIENVWKYPRPPALQRCTSRLRVVWHSPHGETTTIADTTGAYRVLETSHPPTYYLPPSDVRMELLKTSSARRTMCEWKGLATYHDLTLPGASESASASASAPVAKARIWSYPKPTPSFESIADYLSFYATSQSDKTAVGEWKCYVDDDEVSAQEGDFYGSWITPEIQGGDRGFKGGAGTWGW